MIKNVCKAKRKDNKEWIFGFLIYKRVINENNNKVRCPFIIPCDENDCVILDEVGKFDIIPVIRETVCYSTNLLDKHKNEIFTGDILKGCCKLESIIKDDRNKDYYFEGVVTYKDGKFELDGERLILTTYYGLKYLHTACKFNEYEIFGNIHD